MHQENGLGGEQGAGMDNLQLSRDMDIFYRETCTTKSYLIFRPASPPRSSRFEYLTFARDSLRFASWFLTYQPNSTESAAHGLVPALTGVNQSTVAST